MSSATKCFVEQLHPMQNWSPAACLQMQLTTNISGDDHVRVAGQDVLHLVVTQLMAEFGLEQ